MRKMMYPLIILSPLIFLCITLVQGQPQLLSYLDKVQLRNFKGETQDVDCSRNPGIYRLIRFYDLSEVEILPDHTTRLKPLLSFNIYDIVVLTENRIVIQAFENNTIELVDLHCTISPPTDGGRKILETYRSISGIQYAEQPNYTLTKVWKFTEPEMAGNVVQLMDSSVLYIEDVLSLDHTQISQRRFTIKSTQDETKLLVFSSYFFGVLPIGESDTNSILLVIEEVLNTDDSELLHYYVIDFADTSIRKTFLDNVTDVAVRLSKKLFNKMYPDDNRYQ